MGRPREHDEHTRAALLAAAERLVAENGPDGISIRAAAELAGTTTRAVYALFGSKEGLLSALAHQAFEHLSGLLAAVPVTDDPAADLIEAGAVGYRDFVRAHPSVYRVAFQRTTTGRLPEAFFAARKRVWATLEDRVRRLADAGLLGGRSVTAAAVEFNAMCEGLANAELRGGSMRQATGEADDDVTWREAFETLVRGFAAS